jgi:pimeloyl-ACP methyl ester carboxylesterase
LIALLAGCAEIQPPLGHVVMFDRKGQPAEYARSVFPSRYSVRPRMDADSRGSPFQDVIEGIERSGRKRVFLFIHGGLNTEYGSRNRAKLISDALEAKPDAPYPVFLNWDSSLVSSYLNERLFLTREGREWPPWAGILWSPFVVLGDLAKGLTRMPLIALLEARAVFEAAETLLPADTDLANKLPAPLRGPEDETAREIANELLCESGDRASIGTKGEEQARPWTALWWLLGLPVRVAASPIVEGAGGGAWQMMSRRTKLLLHPDLEFECEHTECPDSALLGFLGELRALQDELGIEVDLIGHSMGAMVASQILVEAAADENSIPRFSNIIFMAAAVPVREYLISVIPYLMLHEETKMYHLTLHDRAERAERHPSGGEPLDLTTPGSLLVWIDRFFESPETLLDNTAGRYLSLMHAERYTPARVKPRVFYKVFPEGANRPHPQVHGDFARALDDKRGEHEFWSPEFWAPSRENTDGYWKTCEPSGMGDGDSIP